MTERFDRDTLIDKLKGVIEFKNERFAELRNDPLKHATEGKEDALIQYNPMLDNIRIGAFTSSTFDFEGISWKLRLLSSEEHADLRLEVLKIMTENNCFEKWYVDYLVAIKFLARAATPSPYKTDEAPFKEKDLKQLSMSTLIQLYLYYVSFEAIATKSPDALTKQETEDLILLLKKKSLRLEDLERSSLLTAAKYYSSLCEHLEKTLSEGSSN